MKKILLLLAILAAVSLPVISDAAEKPNLNSVTQSELAADPGIGEELAQKIVDLRSDMGDFTGWDDLKSIEGMTEEKIKYFSEHFQIVDVANVDCNC